MEEMKNCVSCSHQIDASARLCPYCGANPDTGEKIDPTPIVEEHFPKRPPLSAFERFMLYLRQRQGIGVALLAAVAFLALWGLHQFASSRNEAAADDVPTVALTDIADLANQQNEPDAPIPDIQFSYDGNPRTMQTFLVEPGAVAPVAPPSLVARPQTPGAAPGAPSVGIARPSQYVGGQLPPPQQPAPVRPGVAVPQPAQGTTPPQQAPATPRP